MYTNITFTPTQATNQVLANMSTLHVHLLPLFNITTTTTQSPSTTTTGPGRGGGGDSGGDSGGGEVDPGSNSGEEWNLVVWLAVGGSLLCLMSVLIGYVFMVWLPRRGYERMESSRRRDLEEVTQILEEARGRPRKVSPDESLTESERHFLIHDFRDFL